MFAAKNTSIPEPEPIYGSLAFHHHAHIFDEAFSCLSDWYSNTPTKLFRKANCPGDVVLKKSNPASLSSSPKYSIFFIFIYHAQHRDELDARSTFMQLNWSLEYTNTCNITEGTLEDDKI